MTLQGNPVVAGKLTKACDFNCGKDGEELILFLNTDNGHKWICHPSCLREQLDLWAEALAET